MTASAGLPSTSGAWAMAWSAARAREKSKVVAVIPSGSKTCACMARSYAAPSSRPGKRTCPAVKPAAPAMGLEYWNISPNLLVGCMVPRVARAPSGVRPPNSKIHPRASRARPGHTRIRGFPSPPRRGVGLGGKAVESELHLGAALLAHRLRHVVDSDRPAATGVARRSLHVPALVGRRLVHVVPVPGPAEAVRLIVNHLERPPRLR